MSTADRVFIAILDHWRANAVPPVIRDVMKVTGVTTTSMIAYAYKRLAKDGRIVIVQRHPVPVEILKLIKGDFAQ